MRFRQLFRFLARCLRCISFGAQPILSSDWRGKLAAVNDGGRAIPGSGILLLAFLLLRGHKLPPLRPCSMPR